MIWLNDKGFNWYLQCDFKPLFMGWSSFINNNQSHSEISRIFILLVLADIIHTQWQTNLYGLYVICDDPSVPLRLPLISMCNLPFTFACICSSSLSLVGAVSRLSHIINSSIVRNLPLVNDIITLSIQDWSPSSPITDQLLVKRMDKLLWKPCIFRRP